MRLLLVEDDLDLANGLVNMLTKSNYATDVVHTGKKALSVCTSINYSLIILDLGLPDMDGIELLRNLRSRKITTPILILTARDDLKDRIRGLDAGGDDYLSKPFEFGELEARMRALLRRSSSRNELQQFGKIEYDPISRIVTVDGQDLSLTAREVAVLEVLLKRPGRVVSKQQIIESLYTWEHDVNPAAIEVFISRLRKKFDEAGAGVGIRVLRGLGYRLEVISHE